MSSDLRISPRDRLVLNAIIELYIATGEPVASQTVARQLDNKDGMSAATIRNVMASLGDAGLLEQPHTSAGRCPTASAFRLYVEQLNGSSRLAPIALTQERRDQIEDSFAGVSSRQQFLERTSHVLALISSGLGVAMAAQAETYWLDHIHFSRISAGRVLAVVVTKSGVVLDRVLTLDRDLSLTELETAAAFLNQNFRGWSIERIRAELAHRMEQERSEYDQLMRAIDELCRKGALEQDTAVQSIFIVGVANLVAGEADGERLRGLLSALETKRRLIELLDAYVDARQQAVRVVVGLEETIPEMRNLVLIGAPARLGTQSLGTVAVIGSTRIAYQETINAVSFIAQLSDRILPTQ
ncbi:MAG: heat-inducible transcriptional repressor [Acidobacteriaceae bacterium]|jgi:heat-inducible transcriptional repressor|nr:heat-inducible transcriptional repressor [Acidobacteriaceae bacterium]MDX6458032.1 heat-inducible transcriptional repressor [Acidobacteriaceae bacterium]MEA2257737.1 heat-inducible transcriptional repressor [Acidobacteriaceae bacterium]MEA3007715.1 heat-inducible transcriptional repressor [Acidobacteriaceae bacterium]